MNRDLAFDRPAALLHGAQLAKVVAIDDPDALNRVQVRLFAFDELDAQDAPLWARVVAPFAGDNRGTFFMPDVDDEVLVIFIGGDARFPLVVGGLWSGSAQAPAELGSEGNRYKRIRSKNGIVVTLDDRAGQETLTLETPGGQTLTLQDGPASCTLQDANGNTLTLDAAGVTVDCSNTVTVNASTVKVSAGMVKVDTAMATFSGVVKCETLIATSVISTSYTPGAGNIW
jgi:uncharacterized protein involved in type VI secretion and phage assembly